MQPEGRSGVILLRAWLYEGQLVARVQSSLPGDEAHQAAVVLGAEEIESLVHAWLIDLAETQR